MIGALASIREAHRFAHTYGGSGLGLAICRKLLQLYGTDLEVSSTVNEGTTFSFALTLKRSAGSA